MSTYSFKCKDIGMDCGFETSSESMESLMPKIVRHASEAHKITTITDDLKNKVTNAIKTH